MANLNAWTVSSGTATTTTWTTSATSTGFKIYNGGIDKLKITKNLFGGAKKRVITKKGFWDDVKWKEYTSYLPRKSITGKIIIGKMHKRHKKFVIPGSTTTKGHVINTVLGRETSRIQYANTKELFEEKLRGKA